MQGVLYVQIVLFKFLRLLNVLGNLFSKFVIESFVLLITW